MQRVKNNLVVKIILTLIGPVLTSGLYYFDLYSDTVFMITLYMNCHVYYSIMSLAIMLVSYMSTAIYLKFKLNQDFKKAFLYPYYHGQNLLIHTKNNIMATWNGQSLPEESEESKLFGHYVEFLEAITESMPELCLQLIVLRVFGLSNDPFTSFNQTLSLYSSLISLCILFSKVSFQPSYTRSLDSALLGPIKNIKEALFNSLAQHSITQVMNSITKSRKQTTIS